MTDNIEEKEPFKIDDLSTANWAMSKINELEKTIEEKQEFANLEKQKIDEWLENEEKEPKRSIEYFQGLLTMYLMALRQSDPKAKISVPNGTVSTRKKQDKWQWDDEKAIHFFEEEYPDLVQIEKKFNKSDAKKTFKNVGGKVVDENGQLVEFITVEPQGETIVFKGVK